jgi:transcription elongation factor Elf1
MPPTPNDSSKAARKTGMRQQEPDVTWLRCSRCNVLTSHYRATTVKPGQKGAAAPGTLICAICGASNRRVRSPQVPSDQDTRTRLEARGQLQLIEDED